MKKDVVGAEHEFHDKDFALGWSERFVPTPERLELFNIILSELEERTPTDGCIVELGIGPGYLAHHLLQAMPAIKYIGIDFSIPMLEIASARLQSHSSKVTYIQADLVEDDWPRMLTSPVNAILSTWTLHDLGSQENVEIVYSKSAMTLDDSGLLLNGDFVKPDGTIQEFEPGRFQIGRHLELLRKAGFVDVECLTVLEEETESPTPAQNYACFRGVK